MPPYPLPNPQPPSDPQASQMMEPLDPAALPDDLLLLDFPSPTAAAGGVAGKKRRHDPLLDIFVDGIPGLEEGGEEGDGAEEEELEWLSNKEAFPAVETSFEPPGVRRQSPVSVLAAATAPLRVPVRERSKWPRRRKRRVLPVFAAAPARRAERRRCRHCETEETPQWRAGPAGPKTLCNACGVRYKSGRLVPEYRPASSPTFSALLHSNSHRRIMEMRHRPGDGATASHRRGGRTTTASRCRLLPDFFVTPQNSNPNPI